MHGAPFITGPLGLRKLLCNASWVCGMPLLLDRPGPRLVPAASMYGMQGSWLIWWTGASPCQQTWLAGAFCCTQHTVQQQGAALEVAAWILRG
jgi:hypothetical protein